MYNNQKSSDKFWTDESGIQIPYARVTKVERLHERSSYKIVKAALDTSKRLSDLKTLIMTLSQEAFDAFMESKGINKETKGNYTWFNFDRSIKIEINVNEPIVFDPITIDAAKHKLDEFLEANIESKNEFVKQMIIDAFETSRAGQLDTKQVLKLTRHESKVKNPKFTEAINLIKDAIRHPQSKKYSRVFMKNKEGGYDNIELNLSSI